MSQLKNIAALFLGVVLITGCSSTKQATNFNGLRSADGNAVSHVSTSNIALHFLMGKEPIVGDASLAKTVDDFTTAVKETGATQFRIVQSNTTAWWFIFPPFSFLVTPVTSNVAGEAIQ